MSLTAARRDFAADEALLTDVLREVIVMGGGADALRLLDDAVALGQEARLGDERAADRLAELVAGLTLDETEVLVRSLTRWFQLVNLAEDNERVRRMRARDARGWPAPAHAARSTTRCRRCASRGATGAELASCSATPSSGW